MNCHFCHHTCYLSSYKHLYLTETGTRVHGQEFELSVSEHQDSVEKSFIQKRESHFKDVIQQCFL